MKILAISGSLRAGSFNTRLAGVLAEAAPGGVDVSVMTLHGIPLYNADLEKTEGIPEAVEALREKIKAADGVIIVTPEYNAGVPGVLKNALDWLTRPGSEMKPTFRHRPTALAGATPGGFGTGFARAGALISLRQLGVKLFPDYLRISRAKESLPEENGIDDKLRDQAKTFMGDFVDFIRGG